VTNAVTEWIERLSSTDNRQHSYNYIYRLLMFNPYHLKFFLWCFIWLAYDITTWLGLESRIKYFTMTTKAYLL